MAIGMEEKDKDNGLLGARDTTLPPAAPTSTIGGQVAPEIRRYSAEVAQRPPSPAVPTMTGAARARPAGNPYVPVRPSLPATTPKQPTGPVIDRSPASENVGKTVARGVDEQIKNLAAPRIIMREGQPALLTNVPQAGEVGRFEPLAPGTTIPDYRSTPNVPRDITTYKPGQYGEQMTGFGPAWTGGSQDVASRARAGAAIAQNIINTLKESGDLYKLDVGFLNNLINNISGLEQTGLQAQGDVYGQRMGVRQARIGAQSAERQKAMGEYGQTFRSGAELAAEGATLPGMAGQAPSPAEAGQAMAQQMVKPLIRTGRDREGNRVAIEYDPITGKTLRRQIIEKAPKKTEE